MSRNFTRKEAACKCGCGFCAMDEELIDVLEDVRENFVAPVHVTSWCRCATHNIAEDGAKGSAHVLGLAVDLWVSDISANRVADYLEIKYRNRYGIGRYNNRIHVDVKPGGARRWDKR